MASCVPEELIEDILLRLPVKSLVRFKMASKKCYSLISEDEEFAKRHHLKQSSSLSKNRIYFIKNYDGVYIFQLSEDDDEGILHCAKNGKTKKRSTKGSIIVGASTIKLDTYGIPLGVVVGSANGLICVSPWSEGGCFLWNPYTSDFKRISPQKLSMPRDYSLIGFCYDSYSDDYKIIGKCDYYSGPRGMGIFSLKENSWRIHQHKFSHLFYRPITFFNGAFHWCLKAKIVAFDIAKMKFYHMEIPEQAKSAFIFYDHPASVTLLDWLGSLYLYDNGSLWLMKEYGVANSWTKLATDYLKLPVGFPIENLRDSFPHKESLISPKYLIKDQLQK